MALGLKYGDFDTLLFGRDLRPSDQIRFLAVLMDIALAEIETETITVSPFVLARLTQLAKREPDMLTIWEDVELDDYPYLEEHPGQVGEYRSYPLILDATLDEDTPVILNGVTEGVTEFINVDFGRFV